MKSATLAHRYLDQPLTPSRRHFRRIVNDGAKRKVSECMPLKTGKMNLCLSLR